MQALATNTQWLEHTEALKDLGELGVMPTVTYDNLEQALNHKNTLSSFERDLEIKAAEIVALDDGKVSVGGYEYDPSQAEVSEPVTLEQCPNCERKFNPASLDRHARICKKVFAEKEEKPEKVIIEKEIISKPNKWKKNSDSFRNSLRAAREYNDAIKNGVTPPPMPIMEVDDDLVECPHCSRRFAPTTAERHIPHCANTRAKPTSLHRGTGKPTVSKR